MKKIFIKTMDFLMLDCKQASYLISKKLDKKLNFKEKLQLKSHLMYCRFCNKFNVQSKKIDEILKLEPDVLFQKYQNKHHITIDKKKKIIDEITENQ